MRARPFAVALAFMGIFTPVVERGAIAQSTTACNISEFRDFSYLRENTFLALTFVRLMSNEQFQQQDVRQQLTAWFPQVPVTVGMTVDQYRASMQRSSLREAYTRTSQQTTETFAYRLSSIGASAYAACVAERDDIRIMQQAQTECRVLLNINVGHLAVLGRSGRVEILDQSGRSLSSSELDSRGRADFVFSRDPTSDTLARINVVLFSGQTQVGRAVRSFIVPSAEPVRNESCRTEVRTADFRVQTPQFPVRSWGVGRCPNGICPRPTVSIQDLPAEIRSLGADVRIEASSVEIFRAVRENGRAVYQGRIDRVPFSGPADIVTLNVGLHASEPDFGWVGYFEIQGRVSYSARSCSVTLATRACPDPTSR